MIHKPTVVLIETNNSIERLTASAARISTTKGDAMDIYSRSDDNEKNRTLIDKVLLSGHRSFIEHATFTFAFCHVSALVEQFFIEFRLASFTVKSRRYVDFRDQGYYMPSNMDDNALNIYKKHVDYLFAEYKALLESGVPLEDARFVLPYCFCSNFYCTVNARELLHILQEIKCGRGKNIPELMELYRQMVSQIASKFPSLLSQIKCSGSDPGREMSVCFSVIPLKAEKTESECELISHTENARRILFISQELFGKDCSAEAIGSNNGSVIPLKGLSPRVIENVSATFMIRNISLSAITHLARHRMQSIIIPPYQKVRLGRYVFPQSIAQDSDLSYRYKRVFEKNIEAINTLRTFNIPNELYLCLSGNTLDVISTMNARELILFFNLRCCNRAQWEIQAIAKDMLRLLRSAQHDVFSQFGPSCYMNGFCPEGKLTCGRMDEVVDYYIQR